MNVRKFAVAALAGAATAAAAQQPFDLDLTFRTNITGNFVLSVAPLSMEPFCFLGLSNFQIIHYFRWV
jgi:hypothetical protein